MNGLRLKNAPTYPANASWKKMSRTVPAGETRQQIEKMAPIVKSDTGPAALMAIRRRRGSNHASVVFAGLIGAIAWNLATWYFGLPSSSSHALIGGVVGSAFAAAGTDAVQWEG